MYSVEMEENCSVITTLDEDDAYEDEIGRAHV